MVLLHQEPIKYRAMITFDLLSGLRRGRLLGLRWQDVDFENQTITIVNTLNYAPGAGVYVDTPKNTTSARPLKLSPTAFSMLLEYKRWQDDQRDACGDYWKDTVGRVFTGDDGAPVFPDSLTKWFAAFVKRSGLPDVHIHSPAPHLREPDDRRRHSAPRGLSQTGPCTGQHHGQYLRPRHSVGRREGRTDRREVCRRCDHSRGLSGNRQKKKPRQKAGQAGAGGVTRTPDLRITGALLYQLSYTSTTK